MSVYTEYNVKDNAVDDFIELISTDNKTLGGKIKKRRARLYSSLIANIQHIGVHEYARQILKQNSECRRELLYLIREE